MEGLRRRPAARDPRGGQGHLSRHDSRHARGSGFARGPGLGRPLARPHVAFLDPAVGQLLPLARNYSADPRFKTNFDAMRPGLAEFMGEAVRIYVERLTGA